MGYWDSTDRILKENEGKGPPCPDCQERMYPMDDHGRFFCDCGYQGDIVTGRPVHTPKIPQVTEDMPDEEKAKIPAIHRLNLPPTAEERELLAKMDKDMREAFKSMGVDPGYPTEEPTE